MTFTGDVVVRELADHDGSRWRLEEPLGYRGRSEDFLVPAGFTTDFASVPQSLTWLVPRYGRYTKAAILHDFLWQQCAQGRFSWADADGLLRRAMRELEVPFLRRWLMWGAVRLACIATRDVRSMWQQGPVAAAQLMVVAVLGVSFVVVPLTVVAVFTAAYQLLEAATWVLLRLAAGARASHRPVNRPRLMLPR